MERLVIVGLVVILVAVVILVIILAIVGIVVFRTPSIDSARQASGGGGGGGGMDFSNFAGFAQAKLPQDLGKTAINIIVRLIVIIVTVIIRIMRIIIMIIIGSNRAEGKGLIPRRTCHHRYVHCSATSKIETFAGSARGVNVDSN